MRCSVYMWVWDKGCIMSTWLFNLYMDGVVRINYSKGKGERKACKNYEVYYLLSEGWKIYAGHTEWQGLIDKQGWIVQMMSEHRPRVDWMKISNKKNIYVYFFLLFTYLWRHIPYSATVGSACNNAKKRDKKERTNKKRIEAEGETFHPNTGNWIIYRRWRTGGEKKREQRNKQGAGL